MRPPAAPGCAARFLTEQRRTWRDHAADLKPFVLSL